MKNKAFRITLKNSDYPVLVIADNITAATSKVINYKKKQIIIKVEQLIEYDFDNIIV